MCERRDWDKQKVLASHKRPLDDTRARDGSRLAFQGPGGGAIEGPPLLGRVSAGSAHGGLEYYRCSYDAHCTSLSLSKRQERPVL